MGLEIQQGDLESGLAASGILLGVGLGKLAGHGAAFSDRHAQDPLDKARDHAALLQLDLHAVAAAIGNGFVAIGKAAAEADAGHIAAGGRPIFHRQQGCQLPPGLFQQLVHPGGIEDHGLGLRLEAPGRLEVGGGLHIQGQGDHQLFTRGEARQQGLKTLLKLRAPERRDRFLLQSFLHHTLDQLFEGGGAQPHRTDLLQQHRLGHLALAKARQFDAAAEFADGTLVAGLAAVRRHGHLHRQSTAGAGGGGDFQLGPWGGGSGAGVRTHETGRSSGRLSILETGLGGGWRPSVGTTHRHFHIPTRPWGSARVPWEQIQRSLDPDRRCPARPGNRLFVQRTTFPGFARASQSSPTFPLPPNTLPSPCPPPLRRVRAAFLVGSFFFHFFASVSGSRHRCAVPLPSPRPRPERPTRCRTCFA